MYTNKHILFPLKNSSVRTSRRGLVVLTISTRRALCVLLRAVKSQKSDCNCHTDVSQTFLWLSRLLLQQRHAKTVVSGFRNISVWTCWKVHLDMVYVYVRNLSSSNPFYIQLTRVIIVFLIEIGRFFL